MDYPTGSWIYTSDQLYSHPPRHRKQTLEIECFHKTDNFDKDSTTLDREMTPGDIRM